MGTTTRPRWTRLQRRLHWLVAAGVALQFLLQGPMRRTARALDADQPIDLTGFLVSTVHTWTGVSIGLLLCWRLAVRRARAREATAGGRTSAAAAGGRTPHGRVAAANHALLYCVTGAMVLSGSLHWYAGVDAAAAWHRGAKYALAGLVSLHVAAAAWHALVRRDDVLSAMLGRANGAAERRPAARLER